MFELTSVPIDSGALERRIVRPDAGALVVFTGQVRNHHRGLPVTRLEYEAYDEFTLAEGRALVEEAEQAYPGAKVLCVHRTGLLEIGETAVWIGVTAPHRHTAYAANRHVIEEIKRRLPIWKKELHPDGSSEWVNCTAESRSAPETHYHARQTALREIGATGLSRLASSRVLIVGLGGLGCPAAVYLARAGVGRLTLVDGDRIDWPDLARQLLFTPEDVGISKVATAALQLRRHNPAITVSTIDGMVASGNVRALVAGHDVVLDCTDNFAARILIHDTCRDLGVSLISAAVHQFEGTLDVFLPKGEGCLHCLGPVSLPGGFSPVEGCGASSVFGPAVGILGTWQAAEAIKLIVGIESFTARRTLLVDLLDGTFETIERRAQPHCLCGGPPPAIGGAARGGAAEHVARAAAISDRVSRVYLVAPHESALPGFDAVPSDDLDTLRILARKGPLLLGCRRGIRSKAAARQLRREGFVHVFTTEESLPVENEAATVEEGRS